MYRYVLFHKFLFLFIFFFALSSVSIAYAVTLGDVSISGLNVDDTAKSDILFFEIDLNNSGAAHVLVVPYIKIFKEKVLLDEITGDEMLAYSYRNKKLRIPYNTSGLDVSSYVVQVKIGYAGFESEMYFGDFNILDFYESLWIDDVYAEPAIIGDVAVFSATVENGGSVDLDYSLDFSIIDAFENNIETINVIGSVDRSSKGAVQTSWDTGKELSGNYPLQAGDYRLQASAKYWADPSRVHESSTASSDIKLLPKSNYFDSLKNVFDSFVSNFLYFFS